MHASIHFFSHQRKRIFYFSIHIIYPRPAIQDQSGKLRHLFHRIVRFEQKKPAAELPAEALSRSGQAFLPAVKRSQEELCRGRRRSRRRSMPPGTPPRHWPSIPRLTPPITPPMMASFQFHLPPLICSISFRFSSITLEFSSIVLVFILFPSLCFSLCSFSFSFSGSLSAPFTCIYAAAEQDGSKKENECSLF